MGDIKYEDLENLEKAIKNIKEVQEWLLEHDLIETDPESWGIRVDEEYLDNFDEVDGHINPPREPTLDDYEFYIKNWGAVKGFLLSRLEEAENQIMKVKEAHEVLKELAIIEEL